MKPEISPTWILFASGNSVRIELSLYDPAADSNRPITAYIVSEAGSDVARSASRAAETIFTIAHARKLAPPPTVAGFDLPGLKSGSQIAGSSSGLTLALALAKRLWPENDPGPIAATGEISSSGNGGLIQKISQIEAKAEATLKLLNGGGCFFYPSENDSGINQGLKSRLEESGIKLCPVTSVAEALSISFPKLFVPGPVLKDKDEPRIEFAATTVIPTKRNSHNLIFILAATGLLLLTLAGGLYMTKKTPPINTQSSPIHPPKIIKPAHPASPLTPKPPNITITGESNLTKILAHCTNSQLKVLLNSDRKIFTNLKSVQGQVRILSIKEHRNDKDGSLNSTIIATFQGQAELEDSIQCKIKIEPVTGDSPGSVRQQLTQVAYLIAEKICRILQNPPKPDRITNKSSKGFE